VKRLFDFSAAVVGLLILSPLLAVVAAAIRFDMGTPVIFRQQRAGRGKRPFTIVKFRTMKDAAGPDGQPLPDGQRLTKLGIFLRKTSLDELPQLWNVLKGDLSLVGPRPLPLHYLPYFTKRECLRFTVPPGITGWAQIHGRNEAGWSDRFARDVWYVEHWSLWLDARILLRTVFKVFGSKGIVVDARSIMLNLDEERRHMKPGN
jgi:sugar transferase EpsL